MRLFSRAGELEAELTAVIAVPQLCCVFLHATRESVIWDFNDEVHSVVYMTSRYHMATLVMLMVDMV